MKRIIGKHTGDPKEPPPLSPAQRLDLGKSLRMMQTQCVALQRRKIFQRAECEETSMAAIMQTFYGCPDAQPTKEEFITWGQWLSNAVASGDVDSLNRMIVITKCLKKKKPLSSLSLKDLKLSVGPGNPGRTITNDMIFCSAAIYIVDRALENNYMPNRQKLREEINLRREDENLPPANYPSWEPELQRHITHYKLKGLLSDDK
ncbi:hypothetical protein BH11VER1_BH11VER1_14140 [soil metagenome]